MKQRNQQPVQQQTENKPPIRTNWKLIISVSFILVLLSLWIGWLIFSRVTRPDYPLDIVIPADKYVCEKFGGTWNFCPQNPPPNTGLCIPCACPEGFSWDPRQGCKQLFIPEVDTSGWQTYRNEEFGFEVRYPEEFVVEESSTRHIRLSNRPESFTIDIIVSLDGSTGRFYCEIHEDIGRCEKFTQQNISGMIDWEFVRPNQGEPFHPMSYALIDVKNQTRLAVQLQALKINSETKSLFRTFLSTFRFVK